MSAAKTKDLGELVKADSLLVKTELGDCLIELCLGSITALKVEDKVDTLVVSAFNGIYTPRRGTVIGAIYYDLGISVTDMCKDKKEDLRETLSCWWSKPLAEHLPYKQILCFEGNFKKGCKPPSTISEVFRSLVSLTQNKDMTVIMPLLASGIQRYDEGMMLRLIAEAAVNWMLAGLPLRLLKIVVYTPKPREPDGKIRGVVEEFESFKTKWTSKWAAEKIPKTILYDVYLSYSPADKPCLERVTAMIKKENNALRIFDKHQDVDTDSPWQEEIYNVVVTCSRVIALLSPDYIHEAACIEQFNIAMCLSRKKDILVPFYVKDIWPMPTYIGLIQYIDCRSLEDKDIVSACVTVTTAISATETESSEQNKLLSDFPVHKQEEVEKFDIFVSYCHRDMEIAVKIVDLITTSMPGCKIFFDMNNLTVGNTWQQKLYRSIENSRFLVALLSDSYLDSKVCQEEYNLASAMHGDPNYPITLYDIKLNTIDEWPTWCVWSKQYDLSGGDCHVVVVPKLIEKLKTELVQSKIIRSSPRPICESNSRWRNTAASAQFPIASCTNFNDADSLRNIEYKSTQNYDIIFSYHFNDEQQSKTLVENLKKIIPDIKTSLPDKNGGLRLHLFDQCKLIVPLLSRDYIESSELMEELHTALCRHRFSNEIILFPIIVEELLPTPVHPHLIPTLFSTKDSMWMREKDPSEACLSTASTVIANILTKKPSVKTSFRTLLSLNEIIGWTDRTINDKSHRSQLPLCYHKKTIAAELEVVMENMSI